MSSGENAYEVELNWQCNNEDCLAENEDVTCWAEGDYANAVCVECGNEQEIEV